MEEHVGQTKDSIQRDSDEENEFQKM